MRLFSSLSIVVLLAAGTIAAEPAPQIAWFGTLDGGLAAAKATGRPIMFLSAAPHCVGVPGMW